MSGIILILGGGPNVGKSVASRFAAKGYKVAVAARSLTNGITSDGHFHIRSDLSQSENVESIFNKVNATFGPPNIIVYNGEML
jgi:NAD(P)-dependent dehydrogenase (short-subunit alcohol dehydrogenase family)